MKKSLFLLQFFLLFALVPVVLAASQAVPTRSSYQQVVLMLSLAAFGLMLGQFWLSRLLPRNLTEWKLRGRLRWHKVLGYVAGGFLLLHPLLMIARRFWDQESEPMVNLWLVLTAPALRPALFAWVSLALIVVLALTRRWIRARTWHYAHGLLSMGFAGLATWHVVTVGRHSNLTLSVYLIALATGAVSSLLWSYPTLRRTMTMAWTTRRRTA